MFDIAWSELLVIGVIALIAIGPKELPGALRAVGHWMGKARRMAGEFQSQFQEAMREAEVADIKKQFDDISNTASSVTSTNLLSSTVKDVEDALKLDTSSSVGTPTTPEPPTAETHTEATVHEATAPAVPDPATPAEHEAVSPAVHEPAKPPEAASQTLDKAS